MKIKYNNLYIHFILTTLHRVPVIPYIHRERIEKYITGIIKNYECYLYAIYVNPEHMHMMVSLAPHISAEKLSTIVADSSERFINENNLVQGRFKWQDSCSAFSVSKVNVKVVCVYIENQPEHHKKISSQEEYEKFILFYQKTLDITK